MRREVVALFATQAQAREALDSLTYAGHSRPLMRLKRLSIDAATKSAKRESLAERAFQEHHLDEIFESANGEDFLSLGDPARGHNLLSLRVHNEADLLRATDILDALSPILTDEYLE